MTDTQYGWKCPQCGAILAPWQGVCSGCSAPKTTISSTFGTFSISPNATSFLGFGTVFYSPPKTEATRAIEAVKKWQADGNSVKVLAKAAVEALVDDEEEEDEGDDE